MKIHIINPMNIEGNKITLTNKNIKINGKKIEIDKILKNKIIEETKKLKSDMIKFTKIQSDKKWQEGFSSICLIGRPTTYIYGKFGIFTFIQFQTNYKDDEIRKFEDNIYKILCVLEQYLVK